LERPEIQAALYGKSGSDIRDSKSAHIKYFYFAKLYKNYFVRASVIHNLELQAVLYPDKYFFLIIIMLFFFTSAGMVLITDRIGKSILLLADFTQKALRNEPINNTHKFPDNQLGAIAHQIILIYENLKNTKEKLVAEKEKLIRHLNILEEGIAIFSPEKKCISSNRHFIQYINHISDSLLISAEHFFDISYCLNITEFVNMNLSEQQIILPDNHPVYELIIQKNGKYFEIKCFFYHDKSFEISIKDITRPAKNKIIKQQLTENIAHELKTPVTSIKGFLETLMANNLDKEKQKNFISRAYAQSTRLADLINDISTITKIEEASHLYHIVEVNIKSIVENVLDDLKLQLEENQISVELNLNDNRKIKGSYSLLYSIFRNLTDNSIHYAGHHITICINEYFEDNESVYFSYSDSGVGVPEKDLQRLFERFYRVDKGRGRNSGGTGLGLAIVKNAVLFHKGEISVKNKTNGGLEFLFSISKKL